MTRIWFKQKRFGFGAFPVSWQGWAVTAAYVAILVGLSAWFMKGANEPRELTFGVLALVVTIFFLVICWRTTEGGWRWRWGKND